MTEECKLHACFALKLDQRRYRDGKLFVSVVLRSGEAEAIDVRYFVEDGNIVRPTRQGFRIPIELYGVFLSLMQTCQRERAQLTLWEKEDRSFRLSYCNDEYGEGVNFRYFRSSAKYSGPEKRGIRLTLANFGSLRDALEHFDIVAEVRSGRASLFAGRVITPFAAASQAVARDRNRLARDSPAASSLESGFIHEAIARFLEDD